jgi:threonine dehydrogenase-like Zn-dependent dehydrogenase
MNALYFDGQLALREVPTPRPKPGEALIRVSLAGICGTDREILKGYSSFRGIIGHEFVGRVEECEDKQWLGKRVVGEINITCGECDFCMWGLGRHCPNRTVMGIVNHDGAFAEYMALPVVNLHEVPDTIPDEAAVFVEPLAAAAEVLEAASIVPSPRTAVIGDGRLALLIAQVLHSLETSATKVTVIGKHASKLHQARLLGVKTSDIGVEKLPAASFSLVIDATGSPEGLAEAMRLVEPRGTVVMKSTFQERAHFDTAKLVVDEIRLIGSRCGNFSTALDLLGGGKIKVRQLISQTFPLKSGLEAFEYLNQKSCLKVLLSTGANHLPLPVDAPPLPK